MRASVRSTSLRRAGPVAKTAWNHRGLNGGELKCPIDTPFAARIASIPLLAVSAVLPFVTHSLSSETLVFVDLETTGGTFGVDRVTEIGVVRSEERRVGKECRSRW